MDGTLIVLHLGNHELVCVRHRGSQTLYVSDVIEPPTCVDPGYGKLHVGIYIAAIQDTMNRKQQQQLPPISQTKPPGDGDLLGGDKEQDDKDDNLDCGSCRKGGHGHRVSSRRGGQRAGKRKSGGFQRPAGRKVPIDEPVTIEVRWPELYQPLDQPDELQKTIHVAGNRDVVLLYLQYDVYDSPIPASFLRLWHRQGENLPDNDSIEVPLPFQAVK